MILVHKQNFYERTINRKHEVVIVFGHISPVSKGTYDLLVDGELHSTHKTKGRAYDELVEILKANDWTGVNRF